MNKTTKSILVGTTLLAIVGSASAFAGPGNCNKRGGPMQAVQQLNNLTIEQRDQLNNLRNTQRASMRAQKDAMSDNRDALRAAIRSDADAETIKKLAEAQGAAVTAMIIHRAEMKKKVDAILTEEQRKQLANMAATNFGPPRGGPRGW